MALPFDTQGFNVVNGLLPGGNDPGNSRTTVLGIGATFTGAWRDMGPYAEMLLEVLADQASAANGLQVQWSHTGAAEDATLRDSFTLTAAVQFRQVFARKANYVRVVLTNGGVAQGSLALRTFFFATASLSGAIGGPGGAGTDGLGTGLNYTFVADASVQIATVVVGKRYRICVEGGAGCVINTRNGVAARATDQPYWAYDNWDEFVATRPDVYGQTLIAASPFSTVKLIPMD